MNWLIRWLKSSSVGTIIAYHATLAGSAILQGGFKTRQQLGDKPSLGGGTDNSVSFTTDWSVAKGIFDGFMFAWQIANASDGIAFVRSHLSSLEPAVQENVKKMLVAVIGGSEENILLQLDGMRADGVFYFGGKNKQPMTMEELNQQGFRPYGDERNGLYYSWLRPMTDKEKDDFLYSYLKAYHSGGGVYDPVFFGTDVSNFRGIDRQNIGIVTAEIEIDPSKRTQDDYAQDKTHRYVGSMAELRIFDMSAIKKILDFDPNPGDSPRHTTGGTYYANEPHFEEGVNIILRFIYENYQKLNVFFKQHGIAIDHVVSLIQHNGEDMQNLWIITNTILKNTGIKNVDSMIDIYSRYKKRLDVPEGIQSLLDKLPKNYSSRILAGEDADDILYEMYENDKQAYDVWWTSHQDAYDAEKELNFWGGRDRREDIRMFEAYAKPNENTLFRELKTEDIELVAGLKNAISQAQKALNR